MTLLSHVLLTQGIVADGSKNNLSTLLDDAVHGANDAQRGITLGVVGQPLEVNVRGYQCRGAYVLFRQLQDGQHALQRCLVEVIIGQQYQSTYGTISTTAISADGLTLAWWLITTLGLAAGQAQNAQGKQ